MPLGLCTPAPSVWTLLASQVPELTPVFVYHFSVMLPLSAPPPTLCTHSPQAPLSEPFLVGVPRRWGQHVTGAQQIFMSEFMRPLEFV